MEHAAPETTSGPPTKRSPRFWANLVIGAVILGALAGVGGYLYKRFTHARDVEHPVRIVVWQPGVADPERDIRVVYHGSPVGTVASVRPMIEAVQLTLRDEAWSEGEYESLTFPSDTSMTAALHHGLRMTHTADPGNRISLMHGADTLFSIVHKGGSHASIRTGPGCRIVSVNAKNAAENGATIRSGDEVILDVEDADTRCAIRWTAPSYYTRIEAIVDREAVASQSLAPPERTWINGLSTLVISGMLGLARTSAKLSPAFRQSLTVPPQDRPVEVRTSTDFDLEGLKRTIAYFTDRRRMATAPETNAELLAGRIDTAIDQVNRLLGDVRTKTLPVANGTLGKVGSTLDSVERILDTDVKGLIAEIRHLTVTAGPAITRTADTTASTLAGLQLRLDMLMEELRATLVQVRRTLKTTGDDVHKATERINGKEVR